MKMKTVRIKLFRSRLNGKPIEHLEVVKTQMKESLFVVVCKNSTFIYPICNIWEIEEIETKNKSNIQTQRIRIDNDIIMEKDIQGS
jgi:hypothetical protein